MMPVSSKRGSALLIVLGLVAFMVVSAVAFSAYMRSSRLPSSYLRQGVASRMLVKAALAEAIDEIDAAIGNAPHPGVGSPNTRNSSNTKNGANYNNWVGRVYMGNSYSGNGSSTYNLLNQRSTVPTLNLEALAYIPPPLVNEARYYSRHSHAGTWHSLGFDSGRYAFCAIDVSDYFDINAMYADKARSSDSGERVSLSYLFENANHTSAASNASGWDTFISQYVNDVPFVSLADWNLAMGTRNIGDLKSYFYKYVQSGQEDFYCDEASGSGTNQIAKMTFVTDGWFPQDEKQVRNNNNSSSGNQNYEIIDITKEENQPFESAFLEAYPPNLAQIIKGQGAKDMKISERLQKCICPLGFITLYDYLDPDKIPVSLAIPTAERVPMICSIQPAVQLTQPLEIVEQQESESVEGDPNSGQQTVTRVVSYHLKNMNLLRNTMVDVGLVYPFRHEDELSDKFKLDGRLAFFFTRDAASTGVIGLRVGSGANQLLRSGDKSVFDSSKENNGVYSVLFAKDKTLTLPTEIVEEQDAKLTYSPALLTDAGSLPNDVKLFTVTYQWKQTQGSPKDPNSLNNIVDATCDFKPLDADGKPVEIAGLAEKLRSGNAAELTLNLNVAAWARVKYSSGDGITNPNATVDMAPACLDDDKTFNNINNSNFAQVLGVGRGSPLLKFKTNLQLDCTLSVQGNKIALAKPTTQGSVELTPKAAMVGDPRYNHASESWFACDTASQWLELCGRNGQGKDGDIFMSISDQGYLQSFYELCNLPRLTSFYNNGNNYTDIAGNYRNPETAVGQRKDIASSFGEAVNSDLMWSTYSPYLHNDDFVSPCIVSGGAGYKVNPYSDSINVLMAAFANTPHDWRVASTNNTDGALKSRNTMKASAFNKKYAWNAYSDGDRLEWDELTDVADALSYSVRSGQDFETAWRQLGWSTNPNYLLNGGVQLQEPVYTADKKFLYGYWHDCFAAKQQLFLIFVRAEPMMMGGGDSTSTPPQLGARAVALVWRDPVNRSNDDYAPHRTRVLFYRQLD